MPIREINSLFYLQKKIYFWRQFRPRG